MKTFVCVISELYENNTSKIKYDHGKFKLIELL